LKNNIEEQLILSVFPKTVKEQAAVAARLKPSSYLAKRLDLRGKTVLSFGDSPNGYSECALSLYRTAYGWQLGVHIADVAEYVCEGSPLDTEARRRRASVHNGFVNVDMLPEAIAREICNLAPSDDKLALSVLLDIAPSGALISVKFEESVLRVAERCIYNEIDQFGLAQDTSSVLMLRDKYQPYVPILADMYELAALFCSARLKRGAIDCPVFRRKFERDANGNPISFTLESEPDARAMVREIGYFAAEAIGKYMYENGLPCIFVGQSSLNNKATEYLCSLLNIEKCDCDEKCLTSEILKQAKGTHYYEFVCEAVQLGMPRAEFSTAPIYNSHCASDKVVSFVRPATRYTDLLTQRALKISIAASGNPKNINLNRQRTIINDAVKEANNAEEFVYTTNHRFFSLTAINYLEHSSQKIFEGFPLFCKEDGSIPVYLCCGALAYINENDAKGYEFEFGTSAQFALISIDPENDKVIVKPAVK